MQVQHEAHILESGPLRAEDFNGPGRSHQWSQLNKSLDHYVLSSQSNSLNSIEYIVCSPTSNLLAILISQANQILLYDTRTKSRCERFPLKSCDKKFSRQSFQVSGMDFSPDGQRLAVGQTDCIIYIYKLPAALISIGAEHLRQETSSGGFNSSGTMQPAKTGGSLPSSKPTITGKFTSSSPITCLIWCEVGIIFGGQDGKVRLISLPGTSQSSGKSPAFSPSTEHNATARMVSIIFVSPKNSMPITLAYRWPLVCIGFVDGSIQVLLVSDFVQSNLGPCNSLDMSAANDSQSIVVRRNSSQPPVPMFTSITTLQLFNPPTSLLILPVQTHSLSICCASSDGQISFHTFQQNQQQQQNRTSEIQSLQESCKLDLKEEVLSIDHSQVNEVLAVATKNRLYFIKCEQQQQEQAALSWRLQSSSIELSNVFALTRVCWLRDGTQLALGCSSGTVELFGCSWSKQTIGEQLDICHIAKNRIRITDRERNLLATYKTPQDIKRVNLLDRGQSVIIWTHGNRVLLARLGHWSPVQQQSLIDLPKDVQASSGANLGVRFLFEPSGFVYIFSMATRELQVVKLGENFASFSLKFKQNDSVKRNLIAARQFPWPIVVSDQLRRLSNFEFEWSKSRASLAQSRSGSARSQIVEQAGVVETVGENSLNALVGNKQKSEAHSVLELFAYVQNNRLNVVDLRHPKKLNIFSHSDGNEVAQIKFSHTGRYLMFRDLLDGPLNLVEFKVTVDSEGGTNYASSVRTPLNHIDFASWIEGTDSLVIQQANKIIIWYDPGEPLSRADELDCRSLNPNLQSFGDANYLVDLSSVGRQPLKRRWPRIVKVSEEQIQLSNKQRIQLDALRIRMYAEIAAGQLTEATNLLLGNMSTQEDNGQGLQHFRRLLNKVGWLAIEQADCELALRVFSKLNHRSLCDYLKRCLSLEEESEQQQLQVMLAKLRGDWSQFEQLALNNDEISSTYRRLNKWSRLIEYLEKSQQFRQRDLAENEWQAWLLARGRRVEAARRMALTTGQLTQAIEMLMETGGEAEREEKQLAEACRLLLERESSQQQQQDDKPLLEVARKLRDQLVQRESYGRAARLTERVLMAPSEALDLYLQAKDFKSALRLAKSLHQNGRMTKEELQEIEMGFGSHLESLYERKLISARRAKSALEHYKAAGNYIKALHFANELRESNEIGKIIMQIEERDSLRLDERLQEECRQVGKSLLLQDNRQLACKALKLGADYEQLVQALLELDEVEEAFRVSLEHVNSNDEQATTTYFNEHARRLVEEAAQQVASGADLEGGIGGKLRAAEKIYVQLVERPELAIEMYKKLEQWDEAIRLIECHQPDQVEATLLHLARQFETRGHLEEAEKCLLRASPNEWTNAVRMYRLAGRWPDAYRVARANCLSDQDPLLVQLAYWWAKSLLSAGTSGAGSEDGIEAANTRLSEAQILLKNQLNCHKQVIEFCCETKNFQFALDLCSQSGEPNLKRQVAIRYANFLEGQHKFAKAEEILMEGDLIELAVRMYVDNDQLQEAIRLIETKLSDSSSSPGLGAADCDATKQRQQLLQLLNETLIESAQRLAQEGAPIGPEAARGPILMHSMVSNSARESGHSAAKQSAQEKLGQAQQLLLRAQRPDLAIEMYKSRGMWQEAIQVAQRFAPRLLEEVERALDEQVQSDLDPILQFESAKVEQQAEADGRAAATVRAAGNDAPGEPESVEEAGATIEDALSAGDWRAARSTMLNSIARAKGGESGQLTKLERSLKAVLEEKQAGKALGQLLASQAELLDGVGELARRSLRSMWCGGSGNLNQLRQLRNVLANCAKLVWRHRTSNQSASLEPRPFGEQAAVPSQSDNAPSGEQLRRLEQCLLVTHHAYTYHCLLQECLERFGGASVGGRQALQSRHLSIGQAERIFGKAAQRTGSNKAVDLLAKLSLSMLRFCGNHLATAQALHSAGIWQLACGNRHLARSIFNLLVELDDHTNRSDSGDLWTWLRSRGESWRELSQYVELPVDSDSTMDAEPSVQQQERQRQLASEARQWLLETLIEGDNGIVRASNDRPNAGPRHREHWAPCLVTGLPVSSETTSGERLLLGQAYGYLFVVRPREWSSLLELAGRGQQQPVRDNNKRPTRLGRAALAASTTIGVPPDQLLAEVVDFLQQLSGAESASAAQARQ